MRIVFMGTPDFAVKSLEALYAHGYEIAAVFTQSDKPKGRGYKLTPPPVKVLAQAHGTPVYQPQSLKKNDGGCVEILREIKPDVIVVAAYGKILPKEVLEIPRLGCVNVHGSLLPKYRGAAPIQHAILNGDPVTGITTMLMDEGIDTGDILLTCKTEVGENETASELFERLAVMGGTLLVETLEALEQGRVTPQKQDEHCACYASMLCKEMCRIDFTQSAYQVQRKICGLSDWPCAYALLAGKRLKIYRAELITEEQTGAEPGTVLDTAQFVVACNPGAVRFTQVQAEGAKRLCAEDFLRGRPLAAGTKLE